MPNGSEVPNTNSVIRLGRSGRLSWGVALALSLTLALNGFFLAGWVTTHADASVPLAYLVSLVLFLPVVLTYADRAMSTRDRAGGGILALFQVEGPPLRQFAAGWLLLLGHVGLAALLAFGLTLYTGLLAQTWFGLTIDLRWLALLALLLASLGPLSGGLDIGSLRAKLIYGSLVVVVGVALWAWFEPAGVQPAGEKEITGLWRVVAFLSPGLWSISLLLCYRRQMRHPRRSWVPALLLPVVFGGFLGAIVSAIEGYPHLRAGGLDAPILPASPLLPSFLETVFVLAGLFAGFVALSAVLASGWRLVETMAGQGFLPGHPSRSGSRAGLRAMMGLMLVAMALVLGLTPVWVMIGLASLSFLWVTALLNVLEAVRLGEQSSRRRHLQLPFHPLFPGLAMAVGVFVSLALPVPVLLVGGGWLLLGGIYYAVYGRRHRTATREDRAVVRERDLEALPGQVGVMVALTDPYTAIPLIQAGARLAETYGGRLIVQQVLPMSEQIPQAMKQFQAQQQLETVEGYVERAGIGARVPVLPFVQVSRDTASGIVDTVREEGVDLLLVAWAQPRRRQDVERVWDLVAGEGDAKSPAESEFSELLDALLRTVPCEVAILRGQLPARIEHVLVPVSSHAFISEALKLGEVLADPAQGQIVALHVVSGEAGAGVEADASAMMSHLPGFEGTGRVEPRTIQATSVRAGILHEARQSDVLLMSASRASLLAQSVFGEVPVEVARACQQPTLLLRPARKGTWLWTRRAWEAVTGVFAPLTPEARAEVSVQMREAARSSTNFFVLIMLAATIATLGLIQGSPAVIIGAMLVAPLMSPIASTAMSIVEGDVHLMRVAIESVLKGVGLAISVGVAITLLVPQTGVTPEILARTRPNLLDLVVALASGAAAGYALSRKEVGSALPGVAISVALVPPLCVVGYGIAMAEFRIAGGAFLLFLTNVIAIILAAVVVFLLLGFRPLPSQQERFRQGLMVSIFSLVVIAIPLGILLGLSLDEARGRLRQDRIARQTEELLRDALPSETVRLVDLALEPVGDGYIVEVTIYNLGGYIAEDTARLEALLDAQLEVPVTLVTLVLDVRPPAIEQGAPPAPTTQP